MSNNLLDKVDHIVFCAPTLEGGIDYIYERTGIKATYGGKHLTRGTHNAIFKISPHAYFEILAPDPENKDITPPRWMGIDLIDQPRITRWAIKSDNIKKDSIALSNYKADYGDVQSGNRALQDGSTLSWQLTDPLTKPEIEVVPFLLDWQHSIHPSKVLSDACQLKAISVEHPNHEIIEQAVRSLHLNLIVRSSNLPRILVSLNTPKGIIEIS